MRVVARLLQLSSPLDFEVEGSRKTFILMPFCLRNEPAGVEQYSVTRDKGPVSVNFRLNRLSCGLVAHF